MREEPATITEDEVRPGIEVLTLQGAPGYEDEAISVANSLSNGLRLEILNEDLDGLAIFHITSKRDAHLIAQKLTEWCERMADPPVVKT